MEYPKINSLWKRNGWLLTDEQKRDKSYQENRQDFIVGEFACPEFDAIKDWHVVEKIDGTNIRIFYQNGHVTFGGRTANAIIPKHLLEHLETHFTTKRMEENFPDSNNVILFGEGYGPKIQACGGNYRKDAGFILFDVFVGGWWLTQESVTEIAENLEIPRAPVVGIMSWPEIQDYVKSKPMSTCSYNPQMIEGVIARAEPLMLFRNGKPLMFKLKCRDFE